MGNDAVLNASNGTLACFSRGTLITTQVGEVPVDQLRQGDLVLTRDNGYQPVRWIGSRLIDAATLKMNPHLRPIRIHAGALGNGMPLTDLLVSPQHRILVNSVVALRMFGEHEVLVAAKHLADLPGIEVADDVETVEYWHFLMDRHQVVLSNGAATESLFTGPEALKSLSEQARAEVLEIFPELTEMDHSALPTPARLLVSGRQARRLGERVSMNRHRLVA
ncbi:hemolysin [Fuscovulum blasticum]|nr:hemolysin [Fuscovulum blasticum]